MEVCVINTEMCDWKPDEVEWDKRTKIIGEIGICSCFRAWRVGGKHGCEAGQESQCPAVKFPELAEEVEARWGKMANNFDVTIFV